jgi:hypothetical protein
MARAGSHSAALVVFDRDRALFPADGRIVDWVAGPGVERVAEPRTRGAWLWLCQARCAMRS